jgi:hypothetical protein
MKVEVQLSGLDGVLDTLKRLPPELVSRNGGLVRAALRRGAMVLVNQARINFRAAVALPGKTGITDTTGFTEKNIVAKRRRMMPGVNGERYVVTVNYKPHPNNHKFRKSVLRANDIAFMMEAGTSKQEPTPWLLPAFKSKAEEAIRTVELSLVKAVDRVLRKIAKGGLGK